MGGLIVDAVVVVVGGVGGKLACRTEVMWWLDILVTSRGSLQNSVDPQTVDWQTALEYLVLHTGSTACTS